MYTKIISQEQQAIVTLAQAKTQLNIIDFDDDDEHVQLLIDAATELAEGYTNRMLSKGSVIAGVTGEKTFFLPYGEVSQDETPIAVTVNGDIAEFTFDEISQRLTLADNVNCDDAITVSYDAGYEVAPSSAKMGILMLLSSLYSNRENTVVGVTVADIPLDSMQILDRIKINGVP